jgi:acyl carrier protein
MTSIDREEIKKLVFNSMEVFNAEIKDEKNRMELNEDTRLFGRDSILDSLGLVNIVVDLEQRLSDKFSKDISLTDDRAMSQTRSPFRDVRSLIDYIITL